MDKEQLLKWYKLMGVDEFSDESTRNYFAPETVSLIKGEKVQEKQLSSFGNMVNNMKNDLNNCNDLTDLRNRLEKLDNIAIKKTATNTVFSDGNPNAKIILIGEAPGENEDLQGIPFCGISGKMLDQMVSFIGLDRKKNLYITNSVFWRPPGNRRPTPEETAICLPFVEKHIALIKPELIILCGSTAASGLLQSTKPITAMRKDKHLYNNQFLDKPIPAKVIFHPSYLLRQSSQKKAAWFDLLEIKKEFGHLIKN